MEGWAGEWEGSLAVQTFVIPGGKGDAGASGRAVAAVRVSGPLHVLSVDGVFQRLLVLLFPCWKSCLCANLFEMS